MLDRTIGELFDRAVHFYPDKIAVKDLNRSVTYSRLEEEVNRCANGLLSKGVQHGDRVALWLKNSIEYVVADFAIAKIGAVKVPLNQFLNASEVAYRLENAEVKLIITESVFYSSINDILQQIDINPHVIVTDIEGENNFTTLLEGSSSEPTQVKVEPDDLAAIMYTGGTTGRSKGVMHTHKTIIALGYSSILENEFTQGIIMLHIAPLPHATGFYLLQGLLRGGTQILHQEFDPKAILETIEKEKVNYLFLVPTMIYMLLDYPEKSNYDISSLSILTYGAAPMAPVRIEQALEFFGPILTQGYAQMEVAIQTTVLSKRDHIIMPGEDPKRLASCGREIIMSKVRIVDENHQDVPIGVVGELITQAPHLMKGYWRMEEETMKAIIDGWLYTGDMAYRDEQGYIYLVDRKKDMIISGGFNVYTSTVESALFQHTEVKQVAVIGVPDEKWGEAVKAIVVLKERANVTEEELKAFSKSLLSSYEVPKTIEFVDTLPLTPYGKIDKKALRSIYWKEKERQIN